MLSFLTNIQCSQTSINLPSVQRREEFEIEDTKVTSKKTYVLGPMRTVFLSLMMFVLYMGFGLNITADAVVGGFFEKNSANITDAAMNATKILSPTGEALISENYYPIYTYIIFATAIGGSILALFDGTLNSRKSKVNFACGTFIVGYLLCGFKMSSFYAVLLGRAICGVGIGLICSVAMPLIDELQLGSKGAVVKAFAASGIAFGALWTEIIAFSVHNIGKFYVDYFFGCSAIFVALMLCLVFFSKYIPYKIVEKKKGTSQGIFNSIKDFLSSNKKVLFTILLLHALQQLCGINYIFMQSRSVFADALDIPEQTTNQSELLKLAIYALCLTGSNFFGSIIASIALFFLPGIAYEIYFISLLGSAISLFFIALKVAPIAFIFIYIVFFAFGLGPITWMITPKIAEGKVDGTKACAFGAVVNFAFSFIVAFIAKTISQKFPFVKVPIYIFFAISLLVGGSGLAVLIGYPQKLMARIRNRSGN